MRYPLALPACLLLLAGLAYADPIPTASIPEDARWVIHLNVDAARGTPLWEMVRTKFVDPQRSQFAPRAAMIEALTGIHLGQDVHDVTLYGTSFDETSICIMIHAPFDQTKITTFLKHDPEFATADHNGHTILTWRDKHRDILMYGTFAPGDVAIVSPTSRIVSLALDTLDNKSAPLKPDSPLVPPAPITNAAATNPALDAPKTMVFWIAGTSIFDLQRTQKVESPFLLQMENASISASILQDRVAARIAITAKSDKIAQQLAASAEGVKAMISLAAADEHAPPGSKMLASTLQNLTFTTQGKTVAVDGSIGMDKLEALADILRANQTSIPPAPIAPAQPLLGNP